jgi:hypothetical protein
VVPFCKKQLSQIVLGYKALFLRRIVLRCVKTCIKPPVVEAKCSRALHSCRSRAGVLEISRALSADRGEHVWESCDAMSKPLAAPFLTINVDGGANLFWSRVKIGVTGQQLIARCC